MRLARSPKALWKRLGGRKALLSRFKYALNLPNPKVFVIGRNKTGTTSLKKALESLGYRVGNQRTAERMTPDWARRDFRRLISYCHSADAFQDVPFSYPFTYQAVDQAFPGSRFILSVRSSADEWYESLVSFQSKRLEKRIGERRLPTWQEIRDDDYVWPGWGFQNRLWRFGEEVLNQEPYDEQRLIADYIAHNDSVVYYFRNRPGDLLILEVAEEGAMEKLCGFLGKPYAGQYMPWENATR